jgi:hypothetical protein
MGATDLPQVGGSAEVKEVRPIEDRETAVRVRTKTAAKIKEIERRIAQKERLLAEKERLRAAKQRLRELSGPRLLSGIGRATKAIGRAPTRIVRKAATMGAARPTHGRRARRSGAERTGGFGDLGDLTAKFDVFSGKGRRSGSDTDLVDYDVFATGKRKRRGGGGLGELGDLTAKFDVFSGKGRRSGSDTDLVDYDVFATGKRRRRGGGGLFDLW